jgi:hypothetical protein
MAIGTYILPICDTCKQPWLPNGWTQDSDPRNPPPGTKPLRCGKCKKQSGRHAENATGGWDIEYVLKMREQSAPSVDIDETMDIKNWRPVEMVQAENASRGTIELPEPANRRCKHRMTNCPICHPKEAA